jgi:hypothetical protein
MQFCVTLKRESILGLDIRGGLDIFRSREERNIQEHLWSGYLELMKAYRNRLKDLLSSGWKGPHSFAGRWVFTGDF